MEKNRQGIERQIAPSVVLLNTMFTGNIGDKGTAEGVFQVVGQIIESDSNGNDVTKYLLSVKSLKKIDMTKARVW